MLEMGGYYNESDFDQLELPAYQRCISTRGRSRPRTARCRSSPAPRSAGGRSSLDQLPPHSPLGAGGVGARLRARGPRRRRIRPPSRRRPGSPRSERRLQRPEPAHERLREGCERLGYDFRLTVRTPTARPTTRRAPATWASATSRARSSRPRRPTLPTRRHGADLVANCRAERILVEGGRAIGVEGRWIDPAAGGERRGPGPGSRSGDRGRLRLDRVSCAAPALGIGGPAVGRVSCGCIPTGAVTGVYPEDQRWWWGPPQSAISHQFADLEDGYGFLSSRRSRRRAFSRGDALDFGARPQGEDA